MWVDLDLDNCISNWSGGNSINRHLIVTPSASLYTIAFLRSYTLQQHIRFTTQSAPEFPTLYHQHRHHADSHRSSDELTGKLDEQRLTRERPLLTEVQNFFFGFAGLVTAAAAWSIWGGDMFPQTEDPKGDPQKWSEDEMRAWLNNVRLNLSYEKEYEPEN
jgi:hypothetical protein